MKLVSKFARWFIGVRDKKNFDESVEELGDGYFWWLGAMVGGCTAAIFDIAWWVVLLVTVGGLSLSFLRFYIRLRDDRKGEGEPDAL